MGLVYSEAFLENNREALRRLEESMTPGAARAARLMAEEFIEQDRIDADDDLGDE